MKLHFFRISPSTKEFNPTNSKVVFGFPEKAFEVLVKNTLSGKVILKFGERDLEVKEEKTNLIPGEKLLLKAKKEEGRIVLEILERRWNPTGESKSYFLREESILETLQKSAETTSDRKPEAFLQILQSLFPFLEWKEEDSYFVWKEEGTETEGFLGGLGDESRFYIRMKRKELGKLEFLLRWKERDLKDLLVESRVEKLDTYLLMHRSGEDLKNFFTSSNLPWNFHLFHTTPGSNQKGWVV